MIWLLGFDDVRGESSGTWAEGPVHPLILLHTTEGDSIEGAVAAYKAKRAWPHLTVDPRTKRRVQHVSLDLPARALRNLAGGVETNRRPKVWQIEIVGYAEQSHTWPGEWLDWLGSAVIGPLARATGTPLAAPRAFVGQEAGYIARTDAPQRFTFSEWAVVEGIVGHQHAPEQTHWDPGRLDVARIITAARLLTPPTPTEEPFTVGQYEDIAAALERIEMRLIAEETNRKQERRWLGSALGWVKAVAVKVGADRDVAVEADPSN